MKRTVYFPDELERQIADYLAGRPDLNFSALVQQAVRQRVTPPDPSALLDLAGLVPSASTQAADRAEDRVALRGC